MAIDKLIPRFLVSDKDERLLEEGAMTDALNVTVSEDGQGCVGFLGLCKFRRQERRTVVSEHLHLNSPSQSLFRCERTLTHCARKVLIRPSMPRRAAGGGRKLPFRSARPKRMSASRSGGRCPHPLVPPPPRGWPPPQCWPPEGPHREATGWT